MRENKLELIIQGMSCTSCAKRIENALQKEDGIKDITVSFPTKKAYITTKADIEPDKFIKVIEDLGYKASLPDLTLDKVVKKEFLIEGMSCSSCALKIEKKLKEKVGVTDVSVNFAKKGLNIRFNRKNISEKEIISEIKKIGYTLIEKKREKTDDYQLKNERNRLIIAWALTLPFSIIMILEMFFHIMLIEKHLMQYIDLIVSLAVIFIIGFPVIKNTYLSIRSLSFNMDSLIGIGTIAAFSTGILNLVGIKIENFSLVGAMIMSINLIGNYLKQIATGRTSHAIRALLELSAKSAHIINDDGREIDIPIEAVKKGDILIVKPGEKIPIDGIIIEGETTIDESIATGESIPVYKKINDTVIGATINQFGSIKIKVTKTGEDTFLSQIIKMVEEAQNTKVPIQEFADKVTSIFVPAILILSLFTFFFWLFLPEVGRTIHKFLASFIPWVMTMDDHFSMALFAAIATLVIACPCALGLATPTALIVGIGKAALNGILIKNGESIQTAKSIDIVLFDKTGTVTKGKPAVIEVDTVIDKKEFISLALSVERLSEHPLARAIVEYSKKFDVEIKKVESFSSMSGKGVKGEIGGKVIFAGSKIFFIENSIPLDIFKEKIELYENKGYTVIILSINKKVVGIIGIQDEIKEDSKKAVNELHKLGIKCVMLTGDNKRVALSIAKEVNIDEVYAELLPEDKINIVKEFQRRGVVVAMVGDGINDAPALKQADVGIAIGTGTDIAIESSDIAVTSGSLLSVSKAIKISKATFKKIRENLFWAFFYNTIAIPLAVVGILHPVIAEIAMATSSINVVINSLRLKKIKLD